MQHAYTADGHKEVMCVGKVGPTQFPDRFEDIEDSCPVRTLYCKNGRYRAFVPPEVDDVDTDSEGEGVHVLQCVCMYVCVCVCVLYRFRFVGVWLCMLYSVFMSIYVCMYVCVCVCVCASILACVCYMRVFNVQCTRRTASCLNVRLSRNEYMHAYTHYTHAHIHNTYVLKHIHTYIMHTYIHTYHQNTYMHTYTQTATTRGQARARSPGARNSA
jgi:hypothetical protein